MNQFYKLGQQYAQMKLGGFLSSVGQAWKGMNPAAQGIAKRMGAGGALGAAGGALLGGEGNRGEGALLGAGLGSVGGGMLGHALQNRATKRLAGDIWEGATQSAAGQARAAGPAMRRLEALKPVYEQGERHLQRRLLPGVM